MTPIQRIRAALAAHHAPAGTLSKAGCLAEIERIVAEVEHIDGLTAADDKLKLDILRASLLNIGRLLPDNMTATFDRSGGITTLDQVFPDGSVSNYVFTGHTPIYGIPVVPATLNLADIPGGNSL